VPLTQMTAGISLDQNLKRNARSNCYADSLFIHKDCSNLRLGCESTLMTYAAGKS
jgi:hypothetical protein